MVHRDFPFPLVPGPVSSVSVLGSAGESDRDSRRDGKNDTQHSSQETERPGVKWSDSETPIIVGGGVFQ